MVRRNRQYNLFFPRMKRFYFTIAILVIVGLGALPLRSMAQDADYRQALAEMLERSNALSAAETVMDQLLPALRQVAPDAPPEYWDRFAAKWTSKELKERLIDLYMPIYRKHFTLKELRKITAFYRSSVGRKLAEATPDMTLEGMEAGQQLGWEIVGEVQRELEAMGYE